MGSGIGEGQYEVRGSNSRWDQGQSSYGHTTRILRGEESISGGRDTTESSGSAGSVAAVGMRNREGWVCHMDGDREGYLGKDSDM